jgi:hypothetical protein
MAVGPLLDYGGRLLTVVRRMDRLFESQDKMKEAIGLIEQRLRAIEDRLLTLESKEDQFITEARSAASAAATMMSSAALNDLVTRLTRVEMRLDAVSKPSPPTPATYSTSLNSLPFPNKRWRRPIVNMGCWMSVWCFGRLVLRHPLSSAD